MIDAARSGGFIGRHVDAIVKRGKTTLIAKRHGITVTNLKIWNWPISDVIIPGQKLYLRPQHSSPPDDDQPAASEYHQMENITAQHAAGNGNAKIFDVAHRRRGMENGLAYHFVICNGTNGRADGKVEVGLTLAAADQGGLLRARWLPESIGICVVGNFQEGYDASAGGVVGGADRLSGKYRTGRRPPGWSNSFVR